jgi:predicted SnoaL-like aldol condensation-catalyzing enzyme
VSKLFDELTDLKQQYDDKLTNEGEDAVKELFKEFFDANPQAESVTWTQYTPYFNDGDTCTFRVHEMSVTINEVEETSDDGIVDESDEDEDEDEWDSYQLSKSEDPEMKKLGEALDVLNDIPEDVLEHVFGDHCRIVATRESFDVDEYDHD